MQLLKSGQWRFNDDDREGYVSNYEPLYLQMLASRKGLRAFVKANRAEIDELFSADLNREPAK